MLLNISGGITFGTSRQVRQKRGSLPLICAQPFARAGKTALAAHVYIAHAPKFEDKCAHVALARPPECAERRKKSNEGAVLTGRVCQLAYAAVVR